MTRQLEQKSEDRQARGRRDLWSACNGGLEQAVANAGGVLTGLSIKIEQMDVLVTVKAILPAGAMIAFVGAETLDHGLRKVVREAQRDQLRWKEDRWAKGNVDGK